MLRSWIVVAAASGLLLGLSGGGMSARNPNADQRSEIDAFNRKFTELHLKMDTPGIMAMWAEDGVDLMQGEAPIVGRKTIAAWVQNILSKNPGYKVTKEEMEFHDIQVCGDWHRNGRPSIRWRKNRKESPISTGTEKWRWYCIASPAASGRSNRKCGMRRRSLEGGVCLTPFLARALAPMTEGSDLFERGRAGAKQFVRLPREEVPVVLWQSVAVSLRVSV